MYGPRSRARVLQASLFVASLMCYPLLTSAQTVSGFSGSFSQAIAIEVPPFRGLEPHLALSYSSQGGNGFAGVGWGLSGFGAVFRMSPGFGAPSYTTTDIFVLDGQELIPCPAGSSPSCTSGGTHTTKNESYLKIKQDTANNRWTVWAKNGVSTVFSPVYPTGQNFTNTLLWGQSSVVDTHNSSVTYSWSCDSTLDCYPASVTFGPYSVTLNRAIRPDVTTAATGKAALRQTQYRLLSVLVKYQTSQIRGYKLGYTTSLVTGRSLLTSVQQFGNDFTIDASGAITGGTSLPARTFQYQDDPGSGSFQIHPAQ
jgi:hypothetical protein